MTRLGSLIALSLMTLTTSVVRAEEWPKWLGPEGTGIAKDKIIDQWPTSGPKKLWSQKVGVGFSSLVGLDGKVYFFAMQGNKDVLTAMDAETGKVLWAQFYTVTRHGDQSQALSNGLPMPEATPSIDGDRIYTYGGGGELACRNLADGKGIWGFNVLDQTGATILKWNAASSPLVTDKFVYVQGGQGGAIAVAVDKRTGKIAWKAESGIGGYAAPILIDVKGTPQLIIFAGKALFALNPMTGKTIWKIPWVTAYDVNAATPIYNDGHLFITSSYGHGCAMVTVEAAGAKIDWQGKEIGSKYQPCILDKGKLYGNSGGILKCLSWPSSTTVWSTRDGDLHEGGSFVIDGDQMIALSESGTLVQMHLADDGPKVLSTVELWRAQKIWSSPVIYHGKLYVKGTNELICFDISAK